MTEDTNAVFPEHFLEFIVHLTNENVKELVVIESGYTSVLFNDEEFAFPACDIEKVHRKARLVLDRPGIKDRIKKCIEERLSAARRKMFFKAFHALAKFFERFGNDPISVIFSRTLGDISTPDSFRALMPAERESGTI
eukprot:gene19950-24251_t